MAIEEEKNRRDRIIIAQQEAVELKSDKDNMQHVISQQNKEIEQKEKKIENLEKLRKIEKKLFAKRKELLSLEDNMSASISYIKYYTYLCVEISFIAVGIPCLVIFIMSFFKEYSKDIQISTGLFSIITLIYQISTSFKNSYLLSPRISKNNVKAEQEKYWTDKNPHYLELKSEVSVLQEERDRLDQACR